MLSEANNRSIAYPPYGEYTTPAPLTPPGQPIVVVQPPAQYITVNSGIPVQGSSSYNAIQPDRNFASESLIEIYSDNHRRKVQNHKQNAFDNKIDVKLKKETFFS